MAAGRAFTFGYAEHRELLEAAGAEVVEFDPLAAEHLPAGTDALVIGGGFPQVYVEDLAANMTLRAEVAGRVAGGMPVVAECAGLLWLGSSLDGREQCGVLPAAARMTGRLTLGYREAIALADSPLAAAGTVIRAHEFHRTVSEPAAPGPGAGPAAVPDASPAAIPDGPGAPGPALAGPSPAWQLADGTRQGWATPGLLASYLHVHWAGLPDAASRLVAAALAARPAQAVRAGQVPAAGAGPTSAAGSAPAP